MATLPLLLFGMAAVGSIGFAVTKKERTQIIPLTFRVFNDGETLNELYFAMSQLKTGVSSYQIYYKKTSEESGYDFQVVSNVYDEDLEPDRITRTYLYPQITFDSETEYSIYIEKMENNDESTIVTTPSFLYTTAQGFPVQPPFQMQGAKNFDMS